VDNHLLTRSMRYAIERKQAEEALSKERDLFHTLMDNIRIEFFSKDDQSRFMRVNRALAERFGLHHPREAMGNRISITSPPNTPSRRLRMS